MRKTKRTTSKPKEANIPEGIKALYDHEAFTRDILDVQRKAEWYIKAVSGELSNDERTKANSEFYSLLRVLIEEAPLFQPFFVEKVIAVCLLEDAFRKDTDRLESGWNKLYEQEKSGKVSASKSDRQGELYGKWIDSYIAPDEVKNIIEKIKGNIIKRC